MSFDQDLANFMVSPVMIILGTYSGALQPEIGRAVGALVRPAEGRVELVVSGWQWPETVANVRSSHRLSVTFARPTDYVSYQVKGAASVMPATAEHLVRSAAYVDAITTVLSELGLDREYSNRWLISREPVVLNFVAESVFVQTPGARAGQMLQTGE